MGDHETSEWAALCCAVCGPLSMQEIKAFFPAVYEQREDKREAAMVYASPQPDFPRLKRMYRGSVVLRKLSAAVMAYRLSRVDAYSHQRGSARAIAGARYALLREEAGEFMRYYLLQNSGVSLGPGSRIPQDTERFWNAVLGEAWVGAENVPSGRARREIMALSVRRYALQALPAGFCEPEARELPYSAALGWGMLRGSGAQAPLPELEPAASKDMIVLQEACACMWAGKWDAAYRAFHKVFRATVELELEEEAQQGRELLLLACLVGVRQGAPHRVLRKWISATMLLMSDAVPECDSAVYRDIEGFFHGLSLWDAVQNRRVRHFDLPVLSGCLACLPLAMGAMSITSKTSVSLPLTRLADAALEAEARGLHLLARYAAAGLLHAYGLSPEDRRRLQALLVQEGCVPLYEEEETGGGAYESAAARLMGVLRELRTPAPSQLYWDICTDKNGYITSLEPRVVEGKPQAAGRRLSPQEVLDTTIVEEGQSRDDAAMAALAVSLAAPGRRGIPLLAEVLVGHPRVRLVQGAYRRVVRVSHRLPTLRVTAGLRSLSVELDMKQFYCLKRMEQGGVSLPAFEPRMQVMLDYLKAEPMLERVDPEELRWLLAELSEYFHIEGSVDPALWEIPPSEGRVVLRICPAGAGYRLGLLVEHLAGEPCLTPPGEGERVMLITTADGSKKCVRRQFEAEVAAALAVVEACPSLPRRARSADFNWQLPDCEAMLTLLRELRQGGVKMVWGEGVEPLLLDPAQDGVRLQVLRDCGEWLEVGAELGTTEGSVLRLPELLAGYRNRKGRFVPLLKDRFLFLTPQVEAQLDALDKALHEAEAGELALPVACLPAICEQWREQELPELMLQRQSRLRECDDAEVPAGLRATLREYQVQGYRWLLARARAGLGACLADDMGLGKTLQTLALLLERAAAGPSLVLAPLSLCSNWLEEAERFAPELNMIHFSSSRYTGPREFGAWDVVVSSYGLLSNNTEVFAQTQWNVVVLDEAQAVKNPAARRSQEVFKLRADARVCLSGTPVQNSLVDMWSIMRFLNPLLLGAKRHYARNNSDAAARMRRLVGPLVLRRTKADVLPQLPPITEMRVGVELSAEERALYESCRRSAKESLEEKGSSAVSLLAALMRLRRVCCHAGLVCSSYQGMSSKLNAMVNMVKELQASNHKALVFSQFTDVLDLAQAALSAESIPTLRLDGKTPAARRAAQVRLFQEGAAQVFLISLRAGGEGLNLTAADYVILLDPWWNPAVEAQAAGRSHRIGQHNPVTLVRLIALNTVEELVMQRHDIKQMLADSVVTEGSISLETLRDLLREC